MVVQDVVVFPVFHAVEAWQGRVWNLVNVYLSSKNKATSRNELNEEKLQQHALTVFEERNFCVKEVSDSCLSSLDLLHNGHLMLLQVNFHLQHTFLLNTALVRMQGYSKALRKIDVEYMPHVPGFERALCDLVTMLSIFTPMLGAELRQALGKSPVAVSDPLHCSHSLSACNFDVNLQ